MVDDFTRDRVGGVGEMFGIPHRGPEPADEITPCAGEELGRVFQTPRSHSSGEVKSPSSDSFNPKMGIEVKKEAFSGS
jgi:hypothetical protein